MGMKIEIKSDVIDEYHGEKEGRNFVIRNQIGWLHVEGSDGYPEKVKVRLNDDQAPYSPGMYHIGKESYYINRFGALQIGALRLVPVASKPSSKAA